MGKYVQKHKNSYGYGNAESHPEMDRLAAQDAKAQETQRADQELVQHSDELLNEIDEILEENAQEFVAAYRQKGGQ